MNRFEKLKTIIHLYSSVCEGYEVSLTYFQVSLLFLLLQPHYCQDFDNKIIGRAYLTVDHPVRPFIRPSIRPSVNVFLLSHLLRTTGRISFETCLRCPPRGLVVFARQWLWSVDKYGRPQPSLISIVIASPPKLLEEFYRNLAYGYNPLNMHKHSPRLFGGDYWLYIRASWPQLSIIMIRILEFVAYTKKMNLCLLKLSIL